jgi:glycosyltransferase involved in cell wall biosynthesis
MTETVGIVVSTFGDPAWVKLAEERALPSAYAQGCEVVHEHGPSLHEARNEGARRLSSDWVVHLDADDELAPGYVEAILAASGDLRTPAVQIVGPDGERPPSLLPVRPLFEGNYLVIGTALRRNLFLGLGGFADWPCWEDWEFFLRAWLAGAEVGAVPRAVYRAHWRPDSRNAVPAAIRTLTYRRIRRRHLNAARRLRVA